MVARAAAKAAGEGNPYRAGDGDYVKGAVGLAKGLRKLGSAYPMVVADNSQALILRDPTDPTASIDD
ncbi:hypothetical protein GW17_00002225 [Ensete ventricosum]|nr:hypothetical protein GW17_00002225 [Ensete ventricosum]